MTEREVWLVNLHAALLGDLGQIDAALARYAAINASPINGRSAVMATMINAALFAESVNRPDAALAAVAIGRSRAGGQQSISPSCIWRRRRLVRCGNRARHEARWRLQRRCSASRVKTTMPIWRR